ncbi:MAG: FtsQ-type POTRA domain-containing protein [Sphaerochaetaceae bacterium]|jgi:hypothetical protein|nr:FtsQ-type POTRA domain-containing protein [Sphaerochaetaceae bacterium]
MDNAYSNGFDYDAYRTNLHDESPYALYVETEPRRSVKVLHKRTMILIAILALLLSVTWYAMRHVPLFDLKRVEFSVSGGFSAVPEQAALLAQQVMGQSIMSGMPSRLEKSLRAIPVVQEVKVRRRFFSSLEVRLVIIQPQLFLATVSADDAVEAIHLVDSQALREISMRDYSMYGNKVFVIEVSPAYAEHLKRYGLDDGVRQAIGLATEMGMDEGDRYRIIGRIRYEESLGKGFGNLVMDLPAYQSRLFIREPVSESRLHDAVRLIKLERETDAARNIALIGQLRYDLYAQSLVRRR